MKRFLLCLLLVAGMCCVSASASADMDYYCIADFDRDGDVDATDTGIFLDNSPRNIYVDPCPPTLTSPLGVTGQTTAYGFSGYSDGDLENGEAFNSPRFVDNADGTITDTSTGLLWMEDADCYGHTEYWGEAIIDCISLNYGECGVDDDSVTGDWRLPNLRELMSLFNYEYSIPALSNTVGSGHFSNGDPFLDIQGEYWTSTTYELSTTWAWTAITSIGSTGSSNKSTGDHGVICVRDVE